MKKLGFIAIAVLLGLGLVATAQADLESMDASHVYVTVDPNIAIASAGAVDAGNVQVGLFDATAEFRVDANQQQVDFMCGCTDLWKGDDPNSEVAAIPLVPECTIAIESGSPLGDASGTVALTDPVDIEGIPGLKSAALGFESSQNNHMSQAVFLTCGWDQDDPEKPQGEYSGYIKLYGMVL